MTAYYADTSAIAKRYISETGSNWIRGLVAPNSGNIIAICDLTPIEFFSLVERRLREKRIDFKTAGVLQTGFLKHTQSEYLSVILEQSVLIHARTLITKYPLRPPDAIQLASAIEASTTLGVPLTFLCADNNLLSAVTAEGFAVDNPNLHP